MLSRCFTGWPTRQCTLSAVWLLLAGVTTAAQAAADGWRASPDLGGRRDRGLQVCIQASGSDPVKWQRQTDCDLQQPGTEALFLNPWDRSITLAANPPSDKQRSEMTRGRVLDGRTGWECFNGVLSTANRSRTEYSLCASQLRKNVAGGAEMVIGNALNLLTGTVRTRAVVDTEALLQAATDSGAIDEAVQHRTQTELADYRRLFAAAQTVPALQAFIRRYESADPDSLVPQARERESALQQQQQEAQRAQQEAQRLQQEQRRLADYRSRFDRIASAADALQFVESSRQYDPDGLGTKAVQLAAKFDAQDRAEAAERQKQRDAAIKRQKAFQQTVRSGMDSHCGLVVEVKPDVVLVQAMVGAHWLRRGQLWPAGEAPCNFLNGAYQDVAR